MSRAEPDHHDIGYVLGAVLAQMEDLESGQKLIVLAHALDAVRNEMTRDHSGHDVWPLISKPGYVWCRECQVEFAR